MKCPYCISVETKVIDSRLNQAGDITRRRRECSGCEARFTTYERVEELMPAVIKKDGRIEFFSRNKVFAGIQKACQKRLITTSKMDELVQDIERRIQSLGVKELSSSLIGEMVMNELHGLDKVAYIRFASVYRDFQDVKEFVTELNHPIASEDFQTYPAINTVGVRGEP